MSDAGQPFTCKVAKNLTFTRYYLAALTRYKSPKNTLAKHIILYILYTLLHQPSHAGWCGLIYAASLRTRARSKSLRRWFSGIA
jgi:hypothetical protein